MINKSKFIPVLCFFITLILCLTFIGDFSVKAGSKKSDSITFINNTENGPGYNNKRGQTFGADSFTVVDGKYFLLDTLNCAVIATDGESFTRNSLESAKYPVDILYYDKVFYVLDKYGSNCTVLSYDSSFNLISASNAVKFDPYAFEIFKDNSIIIVGEGKAFSLNDGKLVSISSIVKTSRKDESTVTISADNYTWDISAESNSYIKYISHNDKCLYYERCRINEGTSELTGKLSLECIDLSGNLVYYMPIDKKPDSYIPFAYFKCINNCYYYLSVNENETEINTISPVNRVKISKVKTYGTKKIYLKWKNVDGADGYEVIISSKKSFKNGRTYNITGKNSHKIKKLKAKTYYVKVRAYTVDSAGNKTYGEYSETKTISVN